MSRQRGSRLALASPLPPHLPSLLGRGGGHLNPSLGVKVGCPMLVICVCWHFSGQSCPQWGPGLWAKRRGMWVVLIWRLCDCLAPDIPLAAINMIWVLVLYFGRRLRSRPAGQASSDLILWCPRDTKSFDACGSCVFWVGKMHSSALSLGSLFIHVLDSKKGPS